MTEKQLPETPWTLNKENKSFSIDMSELEGFGLFQSGQVTGPTGAKVDFRGNFKVQRDDEGDIKFWVAQFKEYTYYIWND